MTTEQNTVSATISADQSTLVTLPIEQLLENSLKPLFQLITGIPDMSISKQAAIQRLMEAQQWILIMVNDHRIKAAQKANDSPAPVVMPEPVAPQPAAG
jgi:hypothetical protein